MRLQFASLHETKPHEYAWRFVFGGLVTVFAGYIADKYGPTIGGLFLAFPGIFPAGLSLVEKHKQQREEEQGKAGTVSARGQASVEAAGASAGTLGLVGFAILLWQGVPRYGLPPMLLAAAFLWLLISYSAWWLRERM